VFLLALLATGCTSRALESSCHNTDVVTASLPTGENYAATCPAAWSDSPSSAALARAIELVWRGHEGGRTQPAPTFDFVPSCTDGVFVDEGGMHFTISWRGSLACSGGFVRALYIANDVVQWGLSDDAASADEQKLGSRSEELMRGILLANHL
jgi:hypothetical protein